MFSFFTRGNPAGIGKRTLKTINDEVIRFLEAREVLNFKVYTIDYELNPVVLIQAVPQKKLRFSNILEVQIKRHLREKLEVQVPAIFWRFKTDDSEEPGPEQVDYGFEESPEYPQDQEISTVTMQDTLVEAEANPEHAANTANDHYDVHHLARKGMEVEEISMGEFDDFLKGNSAGEKSR